MEVKDIDFFYGRQKVLNNVTFKLRTGEITTLIGANGCGKSTLFNIMTKNLVPQKGGVFLNGENIRNIGLKKFAKEVAIVRQYNSAPDGLTVEKLVSYGRISHSGVFKTDTDEDEKQINRAIDIVGISALRRKNVARLSGGQRQRAWIATALAQNAKILFLDEPTTYLDIKYQIEILRLIKRLNKDLGITVMMVLHDINQALRYSDNIIAMKNGEVAANGAPEDIITGELIKEIYGVSLDVCEIKGGKFVVAV